MVQEPVHSVVIPFVVVAIAWQATPLYSPAVAVLRNAHRSLPLQDSSDHGVDACPWAQLCYSGAGLELMGINW
ncbi:hypothetical protein NPIL_686131 [Nephila pilipes]|uniref:Uncharacterized protein n=1 Tax=Nephila pilipes TaxID=299642 RepID=A0A8X6QMD1_NEPPI|nr:hypothetical protein NPIL_686131 [Nephila pilipes]